MTPDARVLQFPPSATARPQDYGQFSRELSADELAGCFCFSDDDQRQIARRRRDVNRLGFAVQLGTVRYLGRFLENPADAPEQVVAWTAREIGVAARTDLAGYGEGDWRWAHQAEIRRTYGYRPFSTPGVEPELVEWLRARAWVTAELRVLMVAAERQRGGELADLRESRRLATLMAFAITAAQRGQDDEGGPCEGLQSHGSCLHSTKRSSVRPSSHRARCW